MPKKGAAGKKGKKAKKEAAPQDPEDQPERVLRNFLTAYQDSCKKRDISLEPALELSIKSRLESEDITLPERISIVSPIGPRGFEAFVEAVSLTRFRKFNEISLWRADLRDESAEMLLELLHAVPTCEKLGLFDCRLSFHTCNALGKAFEAGMILRRLSLDYNPLGDHGIRFLGGALCGFDGQVSELSLRFCSLGPDSGEILSSVLLCNKTTLLDVQGNSLGAQGVISLATGLADCTSIESLNLRGNSFGDDESAVFSLADALDRNISLKEIDLSLNPINENSSLRLLQTFENKDYTLIKVTEKMNSDLYGRILGCVKAPKKAKGGKSKKGGKKSKK